MGRLNVDAFSEDVERPDPEVGSVNHRRVGYQTVCDALEFEPDIQSVSGGTLSSQIFAL